MKSYVFIIVFIIGGFNSFSQANDAHSIVGVWKSPAEDLLIKIDKVGEYFQGRIVWIKTSDSNHTVLDVNNPDKLRQEIPVKGNMIIKELSFNPADGIWEGGTYYIFEEGKLYNCQIKLHSHREMKIARYVQDPQQGVIETWIRQ